MKTSISVRLEGDEIKDGSIELRKLVKFGDKLQKTIDRVAYAIKKDSQPGTKLDEVKKETGLRLSGTEKGSLILEFEFNRPEMLFEGYQDVATQAAHALIRGLEKIESSFEEIDELPEFYDQGVLVSLHEMGSIFNNGISQATFSVNAPTGQIEGHYDFATKEKIKEAIKEPKEQLYGISGHLLMLNFGRNKFKCHLYYGESEEYLNCTFDELLTDEIKTLTLQKVHAMGIATIDPITEEPTKLHITKIHSIEDNPDYDATSEFDEFVKENDTLAHLRLAFEQVANGETITLEELWDVIESE